jgi:hypothetical protein
VLNELSWLQKHERLLLITLFLLVVLFLGNKYLVKSASDADSKAALAQQALVQQQNLIAAQAAEVAQETAALQVQQSALASATAQLAQTQASTNAALAALAKKIATDSTPQAVSEDVTAAYGPQMAPVVEPDSKLGFTTEQAKQLALTKVNYDALKVVDMAKDAVISQQDKTIDAQKSLIVGQTTEIAGLNAESVAAKSASDAEISKLKADARNSKKNWFLRGLAVGAGAVGAIMLHTHGIL